MLWKVKLAIAEKPNMRIPIAAATTDPEDTATKQTPRPTKSKTMLTRIRVNWVKKCVILYFLSICFHVLGDVFIPLSLRSRGKYCPHENSR